MAGTAAAALLRWGLGLWMGELPPFITFFPVAVAAAAVGGTGAGILATGLSALAADLFFFAPGGRLWPISPGHAAGMVLFLGVNATLSVVGGRFRTAYWQSRLQAAALASAANAIVATDRQGIIQWVNPAFEQLTGYAAAEAVGENPRVLNSGKHDQSFFKQMWDTIQAGRVWQGEVVNKRKDGSLYTEEMTITPVPGPRGAITHFIAVKQDVTGRKETEARMLGLSQRRAEDLAATQRLQEISTRFARQDDMQSLLNAILDGAINIIGANKGYVQLLDRSSGELAIVVQRGFDQAFVEFFSRIRAGTAACGAAMRTKQSVIVEDITRSPLFLAEPRALELKLAAGMRAVVCIPLLTRAGQMLGVLSAHFATTHRPSDRDLAFLDLLARQAADFTERTQAAEALRASEQRYRELFESMQEAFFVVEAVTDAAKNPVDWRYVDVNPQLERYMGLSRAQLVGRTYREVVPRADPAWIAVIGKVALTGEPARLEMYAPMRGRWLLVNAYSPRPSQAAILFSDITERKQSDEALRESERQFRTLADSIPNLAWWANAEGYITWYNRRWYEYTGTTPEQMEGWGWQSVHDPEMLPQVLERWKASIATGEPLDMEFPLRGADGRFRWFLTRVMPIKDAAGKVVRWFGTNTDVSAAWEAREVLARNKQELERLVQERTAKLRETIEELEGFSYSIVHDMRGPLRAMQSFAQLAQESCAGCERPESMDFFRRIRIASERMDTLITDALNYSKIVRQDLPLVPVDVGKLVRGMVETYPNLHPPLAEIEVQFDGVVVLGNESALTQVFSNLLGNAVKFVAIGVKPRVTVWAEEMRCTPDTIRSGGGGERRTESGTEYLRRLTRPNAPPGVGYPSHGLVRIWVGDNGIGIPPESQEKVFGMFQRMHGQQDYPGTGIGLTIVRKAMDRMGGRVGVESEPGKGSRFWIELDRTEYSGQRETPARLKEG